MVILKWSLLFLVVMLFGVKQEKQIKRFKNGCSPKDVYKRQVCVCVCSLFFLSCVLCFLAVKTQCPMCSSILDGKTSGRKRGRTSNMYFTVLNRLFCAFKHACASCAVQELSLIHICNYSSWGGKLACIDLRYTHQQNTGVHTFSYICVCVHVDSGRNPCSFFNIASEQHFVKTCPCLLYTSRCV